MKNTPQQTHIIDFLKVLADESRLNLLRILNEGELTVGDLAQKINLGEPTVSHHLTRLREVGLVTLRMAGNQRYYRVNDNGLKRFKNMAQEIEQKTPFHEPAVTTDDAWINALEWTESDKKILREHITGRQISFLPSKQKKLIVLLRWLATLFDLDRLYTENEINLILKTVYEEDYISLRRDLIDFGYLRRERGGGKYWRTPEEAETTDSLLSE
jgi:predicted transcriptional regulator